MSSRLFLLLAALALPQTGLADALMTQTDGDVSYRGAATSGQWIPAAPNLPLQPGDSVFTQPGAQATLTLCGATLNLAPGTELQLNALSDTYCTLTQSQGEVFLNLTDPPAGQILTLKTPRGPVTLTQDAELDISTGDTTTIAVVGGAATIGQSRLQAGEEAYLSGSGEITTNLTSDSFMDSLLAPAAPPPPAAPAAPEAPGTPTVIIEQPQIIIPYAYGYPPAGYHPGPPPPPPADHLVPLPGTASLPP